MAWTVIAHPAVDEWRRELESEDAALFVASVRMLEQDSPTLGRPLVDTIKGSRHRNMKELRPGSSGRSEIRVLFAFDPKRRAILLVAGDKQGQWNDWYKTAIPLADSRFDEHVETLE